MRAILALLSLLNTRRNFHAYFYFNFRGTGVIIVIVFICVFLLPIGFASWYWRERLKSKYHKYCNCYQFGADKDGAEVEDANREFSTELQIKIPNSSGNGNVYDIQNTDWVGDSRKWEIPRSQIRILDRIGNSLFSDFSFNLRLSTRCASILLANWLQGVSY